MSHILIVEDDRDIAELVAHYLDKAGHAVEIVGSGEDVMSRLRRARPDAMILDLMLPGLDGLEICRAVRANEITFSIPIIILTARAEESDRIVGLELGADDYVSKPFSPKELVARVGAVLRRAKRSAEPERLVRYGPVAIDHGRHVVSIEGREIRLTAKEFLLLDYLVQRPGRVFSRDQLLQEVWGYQYTGGTRTVDVHVRRLREKLPWLGKALVTVKQFGYKVLETPPRHS